MRLRMRKNQQQLFLSSAVATGNIVAGTKQKQKYSDSKLNKKCKKLVQYINRKKGKNNSGGGGGNSNSNSNSNSNRNRNSNGKVVVCLNTQHEEFGPWINFHTHSQRIIIL